MSKEGDSIMKIQRGYRAARKNAKARPRCKTCGKWEDTGHYAWCPRRKSRISEFLSRGEK